MAYTYAGRDEKGRMVFYATSSADVELIKKMYGENVVVKVSPELYKEYAVSPVVEEKPAPAPPPVIKEKPSPIPPTALVITRIPAKPVTAPPPPVEARPRWGQIILYTALGLTAIGLLIYLLKRK
jgi:hypothetical protein